MGCCLSWCLSGHEGHSGSTCPVCVGEVQRIREEVEVTNGYTHELAKGDPKRVRAKQEHRDELDRLREAAWMETRRRVTQQPCPHLTDNGLPIEDGGSVVYAAWAVH